MREYKSIEELKSENQKLVKVYKSKALTLPFRYNATHE